MDERDGGIFKSVLFKTRKKFPATRQSSWFAGMKCFAGPRQSRLQTESNVKRKTAPNRKVKTLDVDGDDFRMSQLNWALTWL